jgi:glycosyltransferase involved in cell wall biosynthesis
VIEQSTFSFKKPLRIGLDGRMFIGRPTGIGRYVTELAYCLDKLCPQAEFFVYSNKPINFPIISDRWHIRIEPVALFKGVPASVWYKLASARLCHRDLIDVFWAGATLLPLGLSRKIRVVSTVYDVVHKVAPETMANTMRFLYDMFFAPDIHRADCVLSISEGTSMRLETLLGRKADAVVYPAVSKAFFSQPEEVVENCLKKYKIAKPYLLAVATWEPRKNLELLIETFVQMKSEKLLPHQLVLVGGKGWKDNRLAQLFEHSSRANIQALGYVPDADLPALYTGADVFIFPSTYEGYGIPVLEARACGTCVVTTDIHELREAGGQSSIYVQPDGPGIKNGLLKALAIEVGTQDVILHTWNSEALILARALNNLHVVN